MARSVTEIYNEIIAQKEANPNLDALTSDSQVSIWRQQAYTQATAQYIQELLFDVFKAEVDANIAARRAGTAAWYVEQVKKFQYPGTPTVINNVYTYPIVDPTKQIITRVSYSEAEDDGYTYLTFKVAKGGLGEEQALSVDEKNKLIAYMERVRFAGQKLSITSLAADKLRIGAGTTVYYDGIRDEAQVKADVEASLDNYLKNLDFSGLIYVSKLQDAIQSVHGVIDVVIVGAEVVSGVTATPIDRVADLPSGYIVEDTSSGNSFSDLITYIPQHV